MADLGVLRPYDAWILNNLVYGKTLDQLARNPSTLHHFKTPNIPDAYIEELAARIVAYREHGKPHDPDESIRDPRTRDQFKTPNIPGAISGWAPRIGPSIGPEAWLVNNPKSLEARCVTNEGKKPSSEVAESLEVILLSAWAQRDVERELSRSRTTPVTPPDKSA
jgi:hypothetical protein